MVVACTTDGHWVVWTNEIDVATGRARTEKTQQTRFEVLCKPISGGPERLINSTDDQPVVYLHDEWLATITGDRDVELRDLTTQRTSALTGLGEVDHLIGFGATIVTSTINQAGTGTFARIVTVHR